MDDLDRLFDKDPLKLNQGELDQIIAWLRQERTKWLRQEPTKRAKPKAKPKIAIPDLGPLSIKKA